MTQEKVVLRQPKKNLGKCGGNKSRREKKLQEKSDHEASEFSAVGEG